jgi:hypothetical protein
MHCNDIHFSSLMHSYIYKSEEFTIAVLFPYLADPLPPPRDPPLLRDPPPLLIPPLL